MPKLSSFEFQISVSQQKLIFIEGLSHKRKNTNNYCKLAIFLSPSLSTFKED